MQVGTNARKLAAVLVVCALSALSGQTLGATTTESWPAATSLPRAEGKATVLVFVNPADMYAEAKLAEVAATVSTVRHRPFVAVVHIADTQPAALWAASGKVPQAARLLDKGGVEARRFNVATSGQVLVFDAAGVLQYSGSAGQVRAILDR